MTKIGKLCLFSSSPRRLIILQNFCQNIEQFKIPFEEPIPRRGQNPRFFLRKCVDAKFSQVEKWFQSQKSTFQRSRRGQYFLVADTMVSKGARLLGKPQDRSEAKSMLLRLSGQWHSVFTGFRLGCFGGQETNG